MNKKCLFLGRRNFKTSEGKDINTEFDIAFTSVLHEVGYQIPTYLPSDFTLDYTSYKFIEHLMNDDLVIVNLTDENPSVYYQLSIRHFLEKPIIHIISDKSNLFDLSDPRFYYIHISKFQNLESIKQELFSKIVLFDESKNYGLQHINFIRKAERPYGKYLTRTTTNEKEDSSSHEIGGKDVYPNLHVSTFVERRLAKNELVRRQKQQGSF